MNQILQNKRSKLTIIFFMALFLSLWTTIILAGGKFCPYCGKENPPDARFCGYCGQELTRGKVPKIKHYGIGIGYGQDLSVEDSLSLSLYLDYVSDSGLGWQINMAFYGRTSELVDTCYYFPTIMKYQFQKASGISPYIGIGLSYGWNDYLHGSNHSCVFEEWEGLVPVFCGGVTFFSNSPVQLTCDGKYFLNPDLSKASGFFLSGLVSINW